MKWNDKYLPYSGEKKRTIYNYILSVMKRLLKKHPTSKLTNAYIMNFILNDIDYDKEIFPSKKNHDWFLNELKTNPYLFDFVMSETSKMCEMPIIYRDTNTEYTDLENEKTDKFASVIQRYVMEHQEIPHLFFSTLDNDDVKTQTRDFVKRNYKFYNCQRSVLEYKYEKFLKVKILLERELNIQTSFAPPSRKALCLEDVNKKFDVVIFNWGDFPTVPIYPLKDILLCLVDDISVRILGFVEPRKIVNNSDKNYLFANCKTGAYLHVTALARMDEEIFKKEVIK